MFRNFAQNTLSNGRRLRNRPEPVDPPPSQASGRLIPTYASNGRRLRDRSEESVLDLERRGVLAVRRDRAGRIRVCQFKSHLGADPVRSSAHVGTKYVFPMRMHGHNTLTFEHKELPQSQEMERLWGEKIASDEELDRYIRGIFRRVLLDCMRQPEPPPAAAPPKRAKVVEIRRREEPKVPGKKAA